MERQKIFHRQMKYKVDKIVANATDCIKLALCENTIDTVIKYAQNFQVTMSVSSLKTKPVKVMDFPVISLKASAKVLNDGIFCC